MLNGVIEWFSSWGVPFDGLVVTALTYALSPLEVRSRNTLAVAVAHGVLHDQVCAVQDERGDDARPQNIDSVPLRGEPKQRKPLPVVKNPGKVAVSWKKGSNGIPSGVNYQTADLSSAKNGAGVVYHHTDLLSPTQKDASSAWNSAAVQSAMRMFG
jgi:hypothetical protein